MRASIITYLLLQLGLLVASLPTISGSGLTAHNSTHNSTEAGFIAPNNFTVAVDPDPYIRYKCETSISSPQVENIIQSGRKLGGLPRGTDCFQLNPGGSRCTKMSITGDAVIGICGDYDWGVLCKQAGNAVALIADKCALNGLAGGMVWWDWSTHVWIIVYHS